MGETVQDNTDEGSKGHIKKDFARQRTKIVLEMWGLYREIQKGDNVYHSCTLEG